VYGKAHYALSQPCAKVYTQCFKDALSVALGSLREVSEEEGVWLVERRYPCQGGDGVG